MKRAAMLACLLAAGGIGMAAANVDRLDFAIGKAIFDRLWVPAPSSTRHAAGLGPLFVARSCASCHAGGGATAFVPGRDGPVEEPGLVYRLGTAQGGAHPAYGRELQGRAAGDVAPEGVAAVRWTKLADGRLQPHWRIDSPAYGATDDLRISARRAPSMHGLGRLAEVPDAAILALADPDDKNGDGISGRAALLPGGKLGRFGWKAQEPDIRAQVVAALALDLGLSTADLPDAAGDCTDAQPACRAAPHGGVDGAPEVPESMLGPLVRFVSAAPTPKTDDAIPQKRAAQGARNFAAIGCAQCHRPELPSARGPVRAYTDLLLHDLGPGLDDGLPEGAAASGEWRTAPLWTVGEVLARGGGLLHDGRARSVDEAVRWHDGEARAARLAYEKLSGGQKSALADFVRSIR